MILILGPECLSKCIRQFGARLNFANCEGYSNPIKWSEENQHMDTVIEQNDNEFPFTCGEECQQKCGKDLNRQEGEANPDYSNYNPDIDFTNCEVVDNMCVEKKLNMMVEAVKKQLLAKIVLKNIKIILN